MNAHRTSIHPLSYFVLAMFALALGVSCARAPGYGEQMQARWLAHRAALDSLAAMATADTMLVGAGLQGTTLDVYVRDTPTNDRRLSADEVGSSGRSAYARLLGQAGVSGLSRMSGGARIEFTLRSDQQWREGLLYTNDALEPLVESLDGPARSGSRAPAYVRLAPDWYLFRELKD